jgi:hypothetical protein
VRTFPLLALCGELLYLIDPQRALAFIAGLIALALWLHAHLSRAPNAADAPTLIIPVANLTAYLLGPIALGQPRWVAVVPPLSTRSDAHFSRKQGLLRRLYHLACNLAWMRTFDDHGIEIRVEAR